MTNSIKQFVLRLIEKKAKLPKDIDVDSFNYIDSGHIDSLGIIKFVVEIENYYNIEITELDMEFAEFKTVGGLISIINRKIACRKQRMTNPALIFGTWNQLNPEVKRLVDVFVSPEGVGRRYLFGRNEHSAALSKIINIDGFVDDFAGQDTVWNNKPVLNSNSVPKQAIVVNCVMCNVPITASKRIQGLGVAGYLTYANFCNALPDLVPQPNFVSETRSDLHQNQEKWETMSASLFDDKSRQVLDDVLNFRLTGDYAFMTSYAFRPNDQYFENFLDLGSKDIFVDAGGFDGDTTEEFCKRYPGYKKVFFFEPSSNNLKKARTRLRRYRSVEFIELGLSNSVGTLKYNPDRGSASSVSESGSARINVTTLDHAIEEKVTFIKMDLEGWEIKALEGSRKHILEDHPKLAISVYHNSSDYWRIFEFVIGLRQDYDVFLRHYTEGWSETVMYFVPKEP